MRERGGKMDRLLVTGGSGLLGSNVAYLGSDRFATQLTYNSHSVSVPECASVRMDLTNGMDIRRTVEAFRPHLIIHTAALLPAQLCEENPALARAIHIDGVRDLCDAARDVGAKLIHISTDWVFDGTKELYGEEDTPNPLNEYARSKLGSERVVQASGVDHCIIRTSLYGWNLRPNKFCYAEMVLETLGRGEAFFAPDDQHFAPILVTVLAEAMFEIYARGIAGVLHVTGSETCSRHEFCRTVAGVFGLDSDLVRSIPFSAQYFGVNAPRHQSLDVTRAKSRLTTRLPGIREGLLEMKRLRESGYVERLRGERH
jgi:dTDP-4-dehydrorhamnose reductase